MEGQNSIQNFFSKLTTRPHIAENIVKRLCRDDIDNCLRASDYFKPLLAEGLKWNEDDFEDAVARFAFTSGTLKARQYGPLRRGFWDEKGGKICFGLDGTLWMSKTVDPQSPTNNQWYGCSPDYSPASNDVSDKENESEDDKYSHDLTVYSLQSGKEISTLGMICEDFRPRFRILPCQKVLVQDDCQLVVFSNKDGGSVVDILEEHYLVQYKLELQPQPFYGDDCIYKLERIKREEEEEEEEEEDDDELREIDENDYEICFSQADGHLMVDFPTKLYTIPEHYILQKSQYVFTWNPGDVGFMMYDISCNKFIWKEEEECPVMYIKNKHDVLLTTTFCGFLTTELQDSRSEDELWDDEDYAYFPQNETVYIGCFQLTLYDNLTGEKIYDEPCGCFSKHTEDQLPPFKPRVVASGNYLLACSIEGGSYNDDRDRPIEYRGFPDDDYHEILTTDFMDNKLLCIKYNPATKKCTERETNTGYEMALLARVLLDEREMLNGNEADENRYRSTIPEVIIHEISFLGFTFESVVVCQVVFDCDGFYKTFKECKTILTIDLDKIFDLKEPASVFSAVNFPLGHNVLESSQRSRYYGDDFIETKHELEYYSYYETSARQDGSGRVMLAGIVEISSEKSTPMMPKIYSFRLCADNNDKVTSSN